jgi:hypothetical protein
VNRKASEQMRMAMTDMADTAQRFQDVRRPFRKYDGWPKSRKSLAEVSHLVCKKLHIAAAQSVG